jgi:hypothetical protein
MSKQIAAQTMEDKRKNGCQNGKMAITRKFFILLSLRKNPDAHLTFAVKCLRASSTLSDFKMSSYKVTHGNLLRALRE